MTFSYRNICRCLCIAMAVLLTALPAEVSAKTYVITNGSRSLVCAAEEPAPAIPAQNAPAPDVFLVYHGKTCRVHAQNETVGQLLTRLGIVPAAEDVLSHDPDTPVHRGMQLRIDAVITRQEVYTIPVPHQVIRCADAALPAGQEHILTPGRDGELLRTAAVTYRNGIEIRREILTETATITPVTEVIGCGTAQPEPEPEMPQMPVIHDGYIEMPTGEILTYYKTDNVTATGYTHTDEGCDLITATGTAVRYGTAAVDPRFIPYGTRMLLVSHDGERYYGIATAEDCGGAIKRDRMDLYFSTYDECIDFGKRRCTIYFLG